MSINEYDEVVAENIALRQRVAALEAEEARSTEYLREVLRKVDEEQKGLAVCSWCALPTNSDAESKRAHQMTCSKSPLVQRVAAAERVVEAARIEVGRHDQEGEYGQAKCELCVALAAYDARIA